MIQMEILISFEDLLSINATMCASVYDVVYSISLDVHTA